MICILPVDERPTLKHEFKAKWMKGKKKKNTLKVLKNNTENVLKAQWIKGTMFEKEKMARQQNLI